MQQLYQCPYCGNNVVYGQPGCHNCKHPLNWGSPQPDSPQPQPQTALRSVEKSKTSIWKIAVGVAIGLLLFCFGSCAICTFIGSQSFLNRTTSSQITIDAGSLCGEYKANQVAADLKYKGKIITVTGTIDSIGTEIMGHPYIVVSGGSIYGVQCVYPATQQYKEFLAQLYKGQSIEVTGECRGLILLNVLLEYK
ncbi:MAG: hypothetical protein ABSF74_04530 [Dehalococcoidia bacterium]|jgi:hypothetical protein